MKWGSYSHNGNLRTDSSHALVFPHLIVNILRRNYIRKWLLSNRELSAKFLLRNAPFQVKAELSKQTGGLDDSAYWQPSVALPSKQRIYVLYNARASILCCHNLQVGTHSNDHRTVPSVCQYVYHMNTEVHQPHHGACVPWVWFRMLLNLTYLPIGCAGSLKQRGAAKYR